MTNPAVTGSRFSVYDAITNKIVAAIEKGVETFEMPWHSAAKPVGLPVNATTYGHYRGINVLALWIAALAKHYPTGEWATYKQWRQVDAQVRQGEQGTLIVFYKQVETTPLEETDPDQRARYRYYARPHWVFNATQVDGYQPREPEPTDTFDRCATADVFVSAINARVEHGFPAACYRRDSDLIEMPKWEWFLSSKCGTAAENYYGVLLHELTHWSGAEHRLHREFGRRFGDHAYAMEELVAELGAAFLCSWLGISAEPREDHAAYIADWLTVLKNDRRAIFTAAGAAQEAHEYLINRATKNEAPAEVANANA